MSRKAAKAQSNFGPTPFAVFAPLREIIVHKMPSKPMAFAFSGSSAILDWLDKFRYIEEKFPHHSGTFVAATPEVSPFRKD
jgi:hypothetical protein